MCQAGEGVGARARAPPRTPAHTRHTTRLTTRRTDPPTRPHTPLGPHSDRAAVAAAVRATPTAARPLPVRRPTPVQDVRLLHLPIYHPHITTTTIILIPRMACGHGKAERRGAGQRHPKVRTRRTNSRTCYRSSTKAGLQPLKTST